MPPQLDEFDERLRQLLAATADAGLARARVFEAADSNGYLSKLRVATYRCQQGCTLIEVIRVGDLVLARSADYKLRPRTNETQSVPAARAKNLNSDNHWPSHVFDVLAMVDEGVTAIPANCRHRQRTVMPREIVDAIEGVDSGHPGAPIRLP